MKKDKVKCGIYLPKEIYAELYRRQLPEHFSFLVACLLEEFFKRTDVSICREEMPTRAEQRAYLERKVRELFSRAELSTEPPKPPVQERMESAYMQERFSQRETPAEPPRPPVQEPSKDNHPSSLGGGEWELDQEVIKRLESLW
jgi:hypothetical protein